MSSSCFRRPLNVKMNASEHVSAVVGVIELLATRFGYSLVYPSTFSCQNMSDPDCGLSCNQLPKYPQYANQQARQSPLFSFDTSQSSSTCSSLPRVFGCSYVAC